MEESVHRRVISKTPAANEIPNIQILIELDKD